MAGFKQKCKECSNLDYCTKVDGVRKCRNCLTDTDKQWIYSKKKEKAKGYKKPSKILKPTGEWAVFTQIWLDRKHECTGCGLHLYAMAPVLFSHTVRADQAEELRLEPDNIELECPVCHELWDKGTWDKIVKQKNFYRRMEYIGKVRPDIYRNKAAKVLEFTGVVMKEI